MPATWSTALSTAKRAIISARRNPTTRSFSTSACPKWTAFRCWSPGGAPGAPPGLQHRNAVHFGQADVENDRVVGFRLAEIMALFAVESAVDHVAGIGQRGGELAIEIGVVLNDEEAQVLVLRMEHC